MSYVYFIKPVGMDGPIKIGCSWNPAVRLRNNGYWVPFKLEVAAMIPGGKELEGRFHRRFFGSRSHYEWFDWSPDLGRIIDEINSGDFNDAELPAYIGAAHIIARGGKKIADALADVERERAA
ncbi:MAG: GIY-YIG nuclease family protein [Xanthomonadales bacterium]|nr:GIY-YIG nuclease family protein [Xanthomonadales bacterium]